MSDKKFAVNLLGLVLGGGGECQTSPLYNKKCIVEIGIFIYCSGIVTYDV